MAERQVVSVVTPTVMDGTVVRWYDGADGPEIASASRNRVLFHRDDVPPGVRDAALGAHKELVRSRNADVRHYATHMRDGLSGPLVPKGGEPR